MRVTIISVDVTTGYYCMYEYDGQVDGVRGTTQRETEKKRRDVSLGVFENHKFRVIFTAPSDDPGGRTAEPSARTTHVEPQRKAEGKPSRAKGGEMKIWVAAA